MTNPLYCTTCIIYMYQHTVQRNAILYIALLRQGGRRVRRGCRRRENRREKEERKRGEEEGSGDEGGIIRVTTSYTC